jgi:hypothetical protein
LHSAELATAEKISARHNAKYVFSVALISHFITPRFSEGAWLTSSTTTALAVVFFPDKKPLKRLRAVSGIVNSRLKQGINERVSQR